MQKCQHPSRKTGLDMKLTSFHHPKWLNSLTSHNKPKNNLKTYDHKDEFRKSKGTFKKTRNLVAIPFIGEARFHERGTSYSIFGTTSNRSMRFQLK